MNLNISYDAATQGSAPSAFFSAVNYVVGLFDATFTNNVTVNIEIGYGAFPFDGSTVPPLGERSRPIWSSGIILSSGRGCSTKAPGRVDITRELAAGGRAGARLGAGKSARPDRREQ